MVNKPVIRPAISGGVRGSGVGRLTRHNIKVDWGFKKQNNLHLEQNQRNSLKKTVGNGVQRGMFEEYVGKFSRRLSHPMTYWWKFPPVRGTLRFSQKQVDYHHLKPLKVMFHFQSTKKKGHKTLQPG